MTDEYKEYVCHYRFGDAEWGFIVKARDWQEAEQRIKAMAWGRVDGELKAIIPAVAPSLAVELYCRIRNWLT